MFPYDVILHNIILNIILVVIFYAIATKVKWTELELKEEKEKS